MPDRSLMERLRDPRAGAERTTREDTEALADSVLAHLRRMLNTRQGIASTVPDYGIPDLTDLVHNFPEALSIVQRSIRASIEQYEPRLRNVTVSHRADEDDPFHLRFDIRGQLVTERERMPVAFSTTLDASGRADIRR